MLAGMALAFPVLATPVAVGGGWAIRVNQYGRIAALAVLAVLGDTLFLNLVAEWVRAANSAAHKGNAFMSDITLWGFDGSTYVRTIKMLLAEKGYTQFKQVQLNVLEGEPKRPEHLERHPFGKVPVLDCDGMRVLETTAIARYLNDVLPGTSLIPATPEDRARMDMIIGIIDSYGYGALIGGVAAFHLFPDFVGGKNEAMRKDGIENGRKAIELAMKAKGSSSFIAGDLSLADLYLAPIAFYVSLTPDKDVVFDVDGFADWWAKIQALQSFKETQPNLG